MTNKIKKKEQEMILKSLNKNKLGLNFKKISDEKDLLEKSYLVFLNRKKNTRISSKDELSFKDHCHFVKNHPYRLWYLIEFKGFLIASIYLKFDNTLGLNFLSFEKKIFINIINLVLKVVKPLPKIDSVRPEFFIMNLASHNNKYKKILKDNGFKKIQETFSLVV